VFILKGVKVLCFDTLLQVFILKVDSGGPGRLAEIFAGARVLRANFVGNVGRKGVRRLDVYFMGYYTIWLALVKRISCSVLGNWVAQNDINVAGGGIVVETRSASFLPRPLVEAEVTKLKGARVPRGARLDHDADGSG
jgi:hypothetical protein